MENLDVYLIFLCIRLLSVFLVQTYFVPDEYWQSLEVAHKFVFGYGHLTWEWTQGIRSYFHPLIITVFYKIVQILSLDYAPVVILGPRCLQALLSAYADLCVYRWSGCKKWAAFIIVSSWFWFYTGSRTLINTFECCLTSVALYKFPWLGKAKERNNNFLGYVAFLCYIRPTAAILWLPLCVYHLYICEERALVMLISRYLPIGVFMWFFLTLLDSIIHGGFVFTPYNFFVYNIFHNIGEFYGTQPWHWYLSSGLPAVLGINLLPFVFATVVILKNRRSHINELALLATIVFTVAFYSFLQHKEFRFISPLLPIVSYLCARYLSAWSRKAKNFTVWLVALIIFLGNAIPAVYFSVVHQKGTLEVMAPLRAIASNNSNATFLFLMPCHSTPLYSHLHVNVSVRFLTCEPDFNGRKDYMDEADQFYKNPGYWLRSQYPANGTLPTHIINFDSLIPSISDILSRYKPIHRIFHTSVPSGRVGKYVVVNERIDL